MLELAEHAELEKAAVVDSSSEEDAATKESLAFLFKQVIVYYLMFYFRLHIYQNTDYGVCG